MSIAFLSGGHATQRKRPEPAVRIISSTRSRCRDRLHPADVEHLAVRRIVGARPQERVDGVVDVDEVAKLRAVAEDLNLTVLERKP